MPDIAAEAGCRSGRLTRVVMALLHGFVLQRVVFGLTDTEGLTRDVRAVLTDAGVLARTAWAGHRPLRPRG